MQETTMKKQHCMTEQFGFVCNQKSSTYQNLI